MKFFVTGRSSNYQRVVEAFDAIESKYHDVTLRWTDLPMIKPYSENQQKAAEYAIQQIKGIVSADVFVLFAHKDGTGVFSEFGAALAMAETQKLQIYAIGDEEVRSASMFHYHPKIQWRDSLGQILQELG
jgi:hypothetical protein